MAAMWHRSAQSMRQCVSLADQIQKKRTAFWNAVHEADDIIDFQIQIHLGKRLKNVGGG